MSELPVRSASSATFPSSNGLKLVSSPYFSKILSSAATTNGTKSASIPVAVGTFFRAAGAPFARATFSAYMPGPKDKANARRVIPCECLLRSMYFPFPIALGELTRGLATDLTMSHGNPVAGEHPAPADEISPPGLKKSEFSAYLRGALGQIYADWPCLYNSSKIDVGVLMRTTIGWFLVIAILLAAYAAWPLIGLYRLASAGETRNSARLAGPVDFPSPP